MRMLTKESREKSRNYQFEYLQKNGYIMEVYNNVTIFHHPTELVLKTFHGTAANHTDFIKFRTAERLNEKIKQVKESADYREKWKAEQKEKNKGKLSSHAAAAAAIRTELKAAFPNTKFSVTSESFAGGDSVSVHWTDGPTVKQVEEISGKYQYGHFDGMNDIYENTNYRDDIPQAKYVSESRGISESLINEVRAQIEALDIYTPSGYWEDQPENVAKQLLYYYEIPANYTGVKVSRDGCEAGRTAGLFSLTFEFTEKTEPTPPPAPVDVPKGKIQFIDYSENAFAVIGETKPIKDLLKSLGGSFNFRLTCGAGWIFSKKKLEAVKAALLETKQQQQREAEPQQPEPLPEPEPETPNFENLEVIQTPENNPFDLDSFTIIWHEGRHIPGATFENATFRNWDEVQKAFTILWDVNEKGSRGGYTKVKCEIKIRGEAAQTFRIDITDKAFNGDFNPSLQHITDYLADDMEMSESDEAMRNALLY